jgi:hypothetical protein
MTASVALVELDGVGWQTWRPGSRAWQTEAWRLYDITGQMRFVANWVGNSCSRCRLYVAEVGPDGETAGETEDDDVAVLAAGPLGTGPAKDEALRLLGINLYVPGESYIVAEAEGGGRGEDAWWVVSGNQMRRTGDRVLIRRSLLHGGGDLLYRPGVDLILRVWTPHPADTDEPDSPTRSAIPDLREIEAIRKREFAELDSRLAGAGILPLPQGIDFPRGDDDPPGLDGFYALLQRVMGTSLQNRSSAEALVPILMTAPPETIDKIKLVTFWSELSDQLLPMREAAVKSLAQSLDVPPEILLGVGDVNHWCTTPDTEILTRAGWKTYDQLAVGEDVLTLNHDTGLSEWGPVQAVKTWGVVAEPMVSIKGRGHSSLTTHHHRWPTLAGRFDRRPAWDTSGGLLARARAAASPDSQMQDYVVLAAPSADLPTDAKYSDGLVELVAWYFTEGATGVRADRRTTQVTIYQSHKVNPDNCARIARCLTEVFGPARASLDKGGGYATPESEARRAQARQLKAENPHMSARTIGDQLGVSAAMAVKYLRRDARTRDTTPAWRRGEHRGRDLTAFVLNAAAAEVILEHAPDRIVSPGFIHDLTLAQLELFIDVAVLGDGYSRGGTRTLSQKDPRMLDAVELAAILTGRYVNRTTGTRVGDSTAGPRVKTRHQLTIGSRTSFAPRGRSFTEKTYTGVIWCPTTPNGTWLARHGGTVFYTGNSGWLVSEDAVTTQIVPVLSRIADALTTGYLRGALEAMGKDPAGFVYAFDTSPLTTRANRVTDALAYHEKLLLSDVAAVESGAFRADQMPDEEEKKRRIVEAAIAGAPSLLGNPTLAGLIGIELPAGATVEEPGQPPAESVPAEPAPAEEPRSIPAQPNENPDGGPDSSAAVVAVAGLAVRRALTLAGTRLIPHTQRDRYPATPRHELHVRRGPVSADMADHVLRGAWDDLPCAAEELHLHPDQLQAMLHGFACELLTRGMAYEQQLLRDLVTAAMRGRRLDASPALDRR